MPTDDSIKKGLYVGGITLGICLIILSIIFLIGDIKIEWLDEPGTTIILLVFLFAGIVLLLSGVYDYYKITKKSKGNN